MNDRQLWALALAARLFVGLVFLVSAWAKLADVEGFAVQVLSYRLVTGSQVALGVAWVVTLLEAALGMALVATARPGHGLHAVCVGLIAGLSMLLAYGWLALGLTDCGCFGTAAKMTPQVSLLKNVVLIAVLVVSWLDVGRSVARPAGAARLHALVGVVVSLLVLVSALPVAARRQATKAAETGGGVVETPVESAVDAPYARFVVQTPAGEIALARGEYFVALLSMSCEHCAGAVPAVNELHAILGEGLPVVALCLGDAAGLEQFRAQNAPAFPMQLVPTLEFFDLIESAPPRFVVVRDGRVLGHWDEAVPPLEQVLGALAQP